MVATTTTDASGAYHFDVNAGTYSVSVQAPAGYAAAPQGQGGNAKPPFRKSGDWKGKGDWKSRRDAEPRPAGPRWRRWSGAPRGRPSP
mgnify:CR=1 FL=1